MVEKIACTTAEVTRRPRDSTSPPTSMPWRQPMPAMTTAITGALDMPTQKWVMPTLSISRWKKTVGLRSSAVIGNDQAAGQAGQGGDEHQQRNGQQQGEEPREDQGVERIDAQHLHGVDLLVHLHRADLGGEGRGRAAGQQQGGDQHVELAQHRDADQLDGEHLGPELAQQVGAQQADHRADEEGGDGDDRDGVQPGALGQGEHRGPANPAGIGDGAPDGHQQVAVEDHDVDDGQPDIDHAMADSVEHVKEGPAADIGGGLGLGGRGHHFQEPLDFGRSQDLILAAVLLSRPQNAEGAGGVAAADAPQIDRGLLGASQRLGQAVRSLTDLHRGPVARQHGDLAGGIEMEVGGLWHASLRFSLTARTVGRACSGRTLAETPDKQPARRASSIPDQPFNCVD